MADQGSEPLPVAADGLAGDTSASAAPSHSRALPFRKRFLSSSTTAGPEPTAPAADIEMKDEPKESKDHNEMKVEGDELHAAPAPVLASNENQPVKAQPEDDDIVMDDEDRMDDTYSDANVEDTKRSRKRSPQKPRPNEEQKAKQQAYAAYTASTPGTVNEDGEEIYCICRQPYIPGMFMIACDKCQEWYHGDCIGLSKREAKQIEQYICPNCFLAEENKRKITKSAARCLVGTCYQRARNGSKYCSDACGVAHAMEKLDVQYKKEAEAKQKLTEGAREKQANDFLQQLQSNQVAGTTLSAADSEDLNALNELKKSKEQLREQIEELAKRRSEFDKLLAKIRDMERPSEGELSAFAKSQPTHKATEVLDCPSCGQPFQGNKFSHHIESCYGKTEFRYPIAGPTPTTSEDGSNIVYCDAYEGKTKTYCKKLKASCPVHNTRFSIATTKKVLKCEEVCGCPTSAPQFQPEGLCLLLKSECEKHVHWESLRSAELELEDLSLQQSLKAVVFDEKVVRERLMSRRAANPH